ncbi:hypothetical protein N7G274_004967 [Stereocaulon virgatum]|uniref:SigF-like NTF2-like domain-containing protein n=1 Tax=Stereocaulon virgatum TaxID=373712 RepID=A0ABR4AAH0_9LECA
MTLLTSTAVPHLPSTPLSIASANLAPISTPTPPSLPSPSLRTSSMEDPPSEIPHVIHLLTQSPPSLQRATIEKYFTPNASFTHPFCRTGSFEGSRWLIWCIYRWYKIVSPRIELGVDSVAYDSKNLILYVTINQIFQPFVLPHFLAPHVSLTTVLHLTKPPSTHRYLIRSQNDLYQVNEFVKFFSLFGVVSVGLFAFQFFVTLFCVLGAVLGWPVSWVEQNVIGGNRERSLGDAIKG